MDTVNFCSLPICADGGAVAHGVPAGWSLCTSLDFVTRHVVRENHARTARHMTCLTEFHFFTLFARARARKFSVRVKQNMFRVAKLHSQAQIPRRSQAGDAGYDLASVASTQIHPGTRERIPTGIALQIPTDCYARIAPRSGLAVKHGIDVLAGVVDASYRGEVQVVLINHGSTVFCVEPGDRVAQLIFERIYTPDALVEVTPDQLGETSRADSGFGSSGVTSGTSTGGSKQEMVDLDDSHEYMLGA